MKNHEHPFAGSRISRLLIAGLVRLHDGRQDRWQSTTPHYPRVGMNGMERSASRYLLNKWAADPPRNHSLRRVAVNEFIRKVAIRPLDDRR